MLNRDTNRSFMRRMMVGTRKAIVAGATVALAAQLLGGCPPELNLAIEDAVESSVAGAEDAGAETPTDSPAGEPSLDDATGGATEEPSSDAEDTTADQPGAEETPADDAASAAEVIANVTQALADRQFEFDSNAAASDNDRFLSSRTTLSLCAFGRFAMNEFTSFSFSDPGFSGGSSFEDDSNGTWAIEVQNGAVFIVLNIENTTDANAGPQQRITVEQDSQGNLILDGAFAQIADIAQACADAAAEFEAAASGDAQSDEADRDAEEISGDDATESSADSIL